VTERARIIAWWIYVACVVIIFEIVLQTTNFAYAVGAALVSIAVLGVTLKLVVARLARRGMPALRDERSAISDQNGRNPTDR
jgi:hypothetical protein